MYSLMWKNVRLYAPCSKVSVKINTAVSSRIPATVMLKALVLRILKLMTTLNLCMEFHFSRLYNIHQLLDATEMVFRNLYVHLWSTTMPHANPMPHAYPYPQISEKDIKAQYHINSELSNDIGLVRRFAKRYISTCDSEKSHI